MLSKYLKKRFEVEIPEYKHNAACNVSLGKLPSVLPNFVDHKVYLQEEDHTYHLIDDEEFDPISVTTLLHKFFEPFNGPVIAADLISKYDKFKDYTVKSLLAEWAQTGIDGTAVHLELENYLLTNGRTPITYVKSVHGKTWLDKQFAKDRFKFYPEVILYDKKLGISGTIDLLILDTVTGIVHIGDWKTNKKIRKFAFGGKKGCNKITAHLKDCNFEHYSLQLSSYAYLLERDYGVTIGNLFIIHLLPDCFKLIPCKKRYNEVKQILALLEEVGPTYFKRSH